MVLFAILILIVFFTAMRIDWISVWSKKILNQPYNYYALLGLLVLGFFAQLDYTDRWGCIIGGESIFSFKNILFSSISIFFVLSSFLLRPRILKISFIVIELAFWIFKLFYFKGGYVVSIVATPDPIISFYDTTTLALRLFIINGLMNIKVKRLYIIITALIIMAIKVLGFPTQLNKLVEEKQSLQRAELTKEKLKGEWTGIYEYDTTYMNKTIHILDSAKIRFDTNLIILYNFRGLDSVSLKAEFSYEFGGFLHTGTKGDWKNYYDFWIRKINSDSLDLVLTHSLTYYEYKMKK